MNKNVLIRLNGISKAFDGETVLDHINLEIQNREFITLLGPSGCGKTTTLRIIGGFETPDSGEVFFDGQEISHVPPYRRLVNTVFQKYALFPHLNVYENVAFGLRLKKTPEAEIKEKVQEMLAMVNLKGFERRRVTTLSGGQQQRVAIARALINMPDIVFADEPTGNLDRANADEVLKLLLETKKVMGQTLVMVTHDLSIAEHADRIFRMDNGELKLHRDYVAGNKKTINTY